MSRAQDIIEKIRRCLQHYDGSPIAEGADIAREYADELALQVGGEFDALTNAGLVVGDLMFAHRSK